MEYTINFEEEFASRYPNHVFILDYMRGAFNKEKVVWDDLTALNLKKFMEYMKDKVCPNTIYSYCCFIKGFLNLVVDEVDLPTRRFSQILKIHKVPQENVALNEEDVEKIYKYYMNIIDKEGGRNLIASKDVLTLFLIECYCGARGCDTEELSERNIVDGRLTYVAKKTSTLATMPVHHRINFLLQHMPKREYATASKNKILKRICKEIGINKEVTLFYHGRLQTGPKYKFIGMHTARRTFASILASKGVPIVEIAQYMSHRDISMTERYIKVDTTHVSEGAIEFFCKKQEEDGNE